MNQLRSVICLALQNMSNDTLASAMNGLAGFQKISKANKAYQPFLNANLIREDGVAFEYEDMMDALNIEISDRVAAGAFI